ncbi:MAG: archaemetzincin family Zn-dependent metalloprotease [Thermoplasmata archaeon]
MFILQPFGNVSKDVLEELKVRISERILASQSEIVIMNTLPVPFDAYDSEREQYRASSFLNALRLNDEMLWLGSSIPNKNSNESKNYKILGIVDLDLFTPELNYIFGQAEIGGNYAVISLSRLHDVSHEKYISRMVKEAVHELGHTFGFHHCPDAKCVMHFSNTLADTDYKNETYCDVHYKELIKIREKMKKSE